MICWPKNNKLTKYRLIQIRTPYGSSPDSVDRANTLAGLFHWHLLSVDPSLAPYVPSRPLITYRKTSSLKDSLTQSEYVGEFRTDPCKRPGTFRCGGCNLCQYMNIENKILLPNAKPFRPTHFANCKTAGVVYLLSCQCGAFYIGKTKQPFFKRASRHITCMRKADRDLPLGRHIRDTHGSNIPKI